MILSSKEIKAILFINPENNVALDNDIYDPSIESVNNTESDIYDASAESDITEQLLEPIEDEDKCLDVIFCISCIIQ